MKPELLLVLGMGVVLLSPYVLYSLFIGRYRLSLGERGWYLFLGLSFSWIVLAIIFAFFDRNLQNMIALAGLGVFISGALALGNFAFGETLSVWQIRNLHEKWQYAVESGDINRAHGFAWKLKVKAHRFRNVPELDDLELQNFFQ